MRCDLAPASVSARLGLLRALYVPEPQEEARARMVQPPARESFERGVARRLAELRALCELTQHLHRVEVPRAKGSV